MYRLNVRCCCQPQKILGTLEVPSLNPIQRFTIMTLAPRYAAPRYAGADATEIKYHTIQLKYFCQGLNGDDSGELAVYSDDRPIEFWRQFKGFIEASKS